MESEGAFGDTPPIPDDDPFAEMEAMLAAL